MRVLIAIEVNREEGMTCSREAVIEALVGEIENISLSVEHGSSGNTAEYSIGSVEEAPAPYGDKKCELCGRKGTKGVRA